MQFLIETVTPAQGEGGADREARQWALVPTLAEARSVAAEACAESGRALAELDALGASPEGELAGEWGRVRFAPAV
jgi:hypothetical protein